MELYKWEILHTYTTYFIDHTSDLEKVAELYVSSGFAESAMTSNGRTFCKSRNGHVKGITSFEISRDNNDIKFKLDFLEKKEEDINEYALDTWEIGCISRSSEIRLFGEENILPQYLRAFIGPCLFKDEEFGEFIVYPNITLFKTGIIILQFRLFSPDEPVELNKFIDDYVNIFMHEFSCVEVPPFLATIAPVLHEAQNSFGHIHQRLQTLSKFRTHCKAIELLTRTQHEGSYQFLLSPLGSPDYDQKESLTTLAQTFFGAVGYLSSIEPFDLKYALLGYPKFPERGNYWKATPHVIIKSHSNQKTNASENESANYGSFNSILIRTSGDTKIQLPLNLRLFDDYNLYITSAISLCVWSHELLDASDETQNLNIYDYIAHTFILDYGYMLHRKLLHLNTLYYNPNQVFNTLKDINELKFQMSEIGPYGEVRNALSKGWKAMGIELLQKQISDNLKIIDSQIKYLDVKKSDLTMKLLVILFGFLSIPSFANYVTEPIWMELNIWDTQIDNYSQLIYFGITAFLIFILISVIFILINRSNRL